MLAIKYSKWYNGLEYNGGQLKRLRAYNGQLRLSISPCNPLGHLPAKRFA